MDVNHTYDVHFEMSIDLNYDYNPGNIRSLGQALVDDCCYADLRSHILVQGTEREYLWNNALLHGATRDGDR